MKLENQVVSLELAKKLKELGVKQESLWYWKSRSYNGVVKSILVEGIEELNNRAGFYSAFTASELGEIMKNIDWDLPYYANNSWWAYGKNQDTPDIEEKTEANARAKMLIYLIENNLNK